jgi:DNA-directed RNA polymerase specialized sigma24 family protein
MDSPDNPSTSPTLLALLRGSGCDEAWGRFVRLYQPLLDARCRAAGLQPADGDDVTARVLAKLVTALRSFEYDPARRFRGYLRTVVASALADFWADRVRRPGSVGNGGPDPLAAVPDPLHGLPDELDSRIHDDLQRARRVIDRVQAQVAEAHWQAYWRTAVDRRPAADVAAELGLTVAAVYMAKSRVGKLLREAARGG